MMRLQTRLTTAALFGVLPLLGAVAGCDTETGRADVEVKRLLAEAEKANGPGFIPALEKAQANKAASPATQVDVQARLGDAELAAARSVAVDAGRVAADAQQLVANLNRMTADVANATRAAGNLRKFEPVEPKRAVATKLREVNEGDAGVWIAPLASASATKASAEQLTAQIAEAEGKIKAANDARAAALAEAETLQRQSFGEQGQASVDTYKRASGKRKEAADLASQVEAVEASLIPLRQDLAIAQGQLALRASTTSYFQQQDKAIDDGWTAVQASATATDDLAKQIAGGGEGGEAAGGPGSIAATADALAKAVGEHDALVATAATHFDNAINHYDLAAKAAQAYAGQVGQLATESPDSPRSAAYKSSQATFAANAFKLSKGNAEHGLATLHARQAELATARAKAVADMRPVLEGASLPMPAALADGDPAAAATTAGGQATAAYGAAVETLTDVAQGATPPGPIGANAKSAGTVALMLTEYGWSQFAAATGDAAAAKAHLASAVSAKADVAELASSGKLTLPAFPPELALPAPAAPAPAAAPAAVPAPAATPAPTPAPEQ